MPISRIETNSIAPSQTLTTPIIATTMGVGGATPSGSGSGITFPATQSASTDANTLDDYEEGVFTPTLGAGSSNPTGVTYLVQEGVYVKIGRSVTVTGRIAFSTYTGGSGNIVILGLPFAAENNAKQSWGAMMVEQVALGSGKTFTQAQISPNETRITAIAGGSSVNYDGLSLTVAAASSATYKFFTFGITYLVSA